jgi:hypothetical protein
MAQAFQPGAFQPDAFGLTVRASFEAGAWFGTAGMLFGSFGADAVVTKTVTRSYDSPPASFDGGAFDSSFDIWTDRPGLADAVVRREQPGSFTVNAWPVLTFAFPVTLDADRFRVMPGSFPADAHRFRADMPGSFTANAYTMQYRWEYPLCTADAIIRRTQGEGSYELAVLASGPAAYFRMRDAVGSSTIAEQIAGKTGTLTAGAAGATFGTTVGTLRGATWASGYVNSAFYQPSTYDATFECWIKTTSTGELWQGRYGSGGGGGRGISMALGSYGFGTVAGRVNFFINSDGIWQGKSSSIAVNDNQLHHIVCVWDGVAATNITGSQMKIYIDGVLDTAAFNTTNGAVFQPPVAAAGNGQFLGRAFGTYTGFVSELAFYTKALTAADAAFHYSTGMNPGIVVRADAVIMPRFMADAWVAGWFRADARIESGSYRYGYWAADAVIHREQTATPAADAVVFATVPGSATADAFTLGYVRADATIIGLVERTFTAEAVSVVRVESSITADAFVKLTFRADAVIFRASSSSATAAAVIRVPANADRFRVYAIRRRNSGTKTFTADAYSRWVGTATKTFTANAVRRVRNNAGSLTADAMRRWVVYGGTLPAPTVLFEDTFTRTVASGLGGSYANDDDGWSEGPVSVDGEQAVAGDGVTYGVATVWNTSIPHPADFELLFDFSTQPAGRDNGYLWITLGRMYVSLFPYSGTGASPARYTFYAGIPTSDTTSSNRVYETSLWLVANSVYHARVRVEGSTAYARFWQVNSAEPTTWYSTWDITGAFDAQFWMDFESGWDGTAYTLDNLRVQTIQLPYTGIPSNAVTFRAGSGSATADAVVIGTTGTREQTVPVDAIAFASIEKPVTADALKRLRPSNAFTADAIKKRTQTPVQVFADIETEATVEPWVAEQIAGFTYGVASLSVVPQAPTGYGSASLGIGFTSSYQIAHVPLPGTFQSGTTYAITFRIKAYAGSTTLGRYQIIVGPKNATTGRARTYNLVPPTSWTLRTTYWTPINTVTDAVLALASYNYYAFTIAVDAVQATAPFYAYAIRRRGWEGTFSASAQIGDLWFSAHALRQRIDTRSLTASAIIVQPGTSVPPLPGKPSVQVWIDGVDYARHVLWATATFNAKVNGSVGDCRFQIIDPDHTFSFRFGQEIYLNVNGRNLWGGWIQRPERTFLMSVQPDPAVRPRTWSIEGVDFNAIFDKRVIHDLSDPDKAWDYAPGTYDDAIIDDVWTYFDMAGFTKNISRVGVAILDIAGVTSKSNGGLVASAGFTLREVFTSITRTTGAIFYCTPEKVITYLDADAVNSAYVLTDRPYVMDITGTDVLFEDTFNRVVADGLGGGWVIDYVSSYGSGASVDGSAIVLSGEDLYAYWENLGIPHPAEFDVQFDLYVPADTTYGWGYLYLYTGNIWVQVSSWDDGEIEIEGGINGDGGYFYNQHFATPGDIWYTVRASQTTAKLLVKMWPRDEVEPDWQYQANVGTGLANDWPFAWELDSPWYPDREGMRIDNLRVSATGGGRYYPPANAVGYRELKIREDATGLVNDALVWGAGYGNENMVFSRAQSETSQTTHGLWQAGQYKEGVYKQGTVNAIASSFVNGSPSSLRGAKDPKRLVQLVTDSPVFGVGDVARIVNSAFEYDDTLPVRSATITFPTPFDPRFALGMEWTIDAAWGMYDPWIPAPWSPPPPDGGCIGCLPPDPPKPRGTRRTYFATTQQEADTGQNTSDFFDTRFPWIIVRIPNEYGPQTNFDSFSRLVTGGWGTSTGSYVRDWNTYPSGSTETLGLENGNFTVNGEDGTHAVYPNGQRSYRALLSETDPGEAPWNEPHYWTEIAFYPYWNKTAEDYRQYTFVHGVRFEDGGYDWYIRLVWDKNGDGTMEICDSNGCSIPVIVHIDEGELNKVSVQVDPDKIKACLYNEVLINGVCVTISRSQQDCTLMTYVVDDFDRVVPVNDLGWTSDLKLEWGDPGDYTEIVSGLVWVEETGGPSLPLGIQFNPPVSATITRPTPHVLTTKESGSISFTQFPSLIGDVTLIWTEEEDPTSPTGWSITYLAIKLPATDPPSGLYEGPASLTTTSPSPNNPVYTNDLYLGAPAVMDPILDASDVFVTRPITGLQMGQGVDIYIVVGSTTYHSDNVHFTFEYNAGTKLWRMGFEDGGSGAMPPALYPGSGADVFADIDFGDFAITGIFPIGWGFEGFYDLIGGDTNLPILAFPFDVTLDIVSGSEVHGSVAGYSITVTDPALALGPFTTFVINKDDLSGM